MKLITIGITAIDGDVKCIMSNNTALGKRAAKSLSSFIRSILFDMNSDQPFIYLLKKDDIISYSLIVDGHIFTICTDTEIYPYTPFNINYLHKILQHIIDAHSRDDIQLISNMITEGESHQPAIDITQPPSQPTYRIQRLSCDRLNKLESDIEKIKEETSKLTMSAAFFAPKRTTVKKSSSFTFMSGIRWFFRFFSICSSCMCNDQENQYQRRHP